MKARLLWPALLSTIATVADAQLVIDNTQTPTDLVQNVLLGSGVQVSNVMFNGLANPPVTTQMAAFDGTNCNVGMASGVILCSGDAELAIGPNDAGGATLPAGGLGLGGDPDLDQALGGGFTTFDAAVLEFDFIPNGDSLSFSYVFGSEEYLEWVNSAYNDVFGFFLSGPGIVGPYSNSSANIALVPGTALPVSIDNVNDLVNPQYYVDNGDGWTAPQNTDSTVLQFDGFTTVLVAAAQVQCGQTYHIKIAVADAGDHILDSGVFLEAGSFASSANVVASLTTIGLNDSTLYEGCATAVLEFQRFGDLAAADTVDVIVSGTATNGVDYLPAIPPEVIFQPGDSIITFNLYAPLDPDAIETVELELQNIANCSGQLVTSYFTFVIDEAEDLYITVQDTAIDCGDTITIGPQVFQGYGLYNYLWNTGDTTATITVAPGVTTTYVVTVSDTCGMPSQTDSIMVTVPYYAPLDLQVSNDTALSCLQATDLEVIQLTGGNGVYGYAWTDGTGTLLSSAPSVTVTAGPSATYYIDVWDGCGFTANDSVQVDPLPLPPIVVSTNPDTTVLCPGDPVDVLVTAVAGGNGVYTYAWTDGQQNQVSTDSLFNVLVNDTLAFTVVVQDQCGNTGSDQVQVNIPQYAPLALSVAADTAICLGTEATLWALATNGAGNYSYAWAGLGTGDSVLQVAPGSTTTYPVTVTDQCGNSLSGGLTVDVQDVTAGFTLNYTGDYDVAFFNTSSPNASEFLWEFGDGGTSSIVHPGHTYLDTEDHVVWLTVWNPIGCVDSTSLLVQPTAHLYVPNAFTPDGDGVNDLFGPVGHDIFELEMRIYDRWGEVIFETEDPGLPWDGRVNGSGEVAQNGIYVYQIKATGRRFGPVEYVGHVALLK